MTTTRRIVAFLAAVVAASTFAVAPATAYARLQADGVVIASSTLANHAPVSATGAPAPCADATFKLFGGKQPNGHYDWAFQASSTPAGLSATGVRDVLRKSFTNVTTAHNDCGLPDNVSATHTYLGTTSLRPRCNRMDGHNVVGFKSLPSGRLR